MAAIWISEPELAHLIGRQEAALLCRTYGGMAFYIPAAARPNHIFAPVIGMPAMRTLCHAYPGQWIQFPNRRRAGHLKGAIIAMLEKGHTQSAIARELGCTERWVQMVAKSTRSRPQCNLPL